MAPVTIVLPQNLSTTQPIDVRHRDLRFVTISGPPGATISSQASPILRVTGRGLTITGVNFERAGVPKAGVGVQVVNVNSDVNITTSTFVGLDAAVHILGGDIAFSGVNRFEGCTRGVLAVRGARASNSGSISARTTDIAFDVSDGASAAFSSFTTDGRALVSDGGTLTCSACELDGLVQGSGGADLRLSNSSVGGLTLRETSTARLANVTSARELDLNTGSTLRMTEDTNTRVAVGHGSVALLVRTPPLEGTPPRSVAEGGGVDDRLKSGAASALKLKGGRSRGQTARTPP